MEFGATHTFASMEEALPAVMELTWGQMADKVIMTPGRDVRRPDGARHGRSTGKGGTIVVTAVAPMTQTESSVNLFELAMCEQGDQGHDLRLAQPARRHPQAARPVPRGPAQARRADHQPLPARRDQRRLPGDARRREHPRRHRARLLMADGMPDSSADPASLVERIGRPSSAAGARSSSSSPRSIADRHILLEGPPGTGKSTLLRAVAQELGVGLRVRRGQRRAHPGAPRRSLRPGPGAGRGLRPRRVRRRPAGVARCATGRCCTSRRSTASPRRRSTCSSP